MIPGQLFNRLASLLEQGDVEVVAYLLAGVLGTHRALEQDFDEIKAQLRAHSLHDLLLQDPHTRRAL